MRLRYELGVYDDNTGEPIFAGTYLSQESLEEDLYKAEHAVETYTHAAGVYTDEAE